MVFEEVPFGLAGKIYRGQTPLNLDVSSQAERYTDLLKQQRIGHVFLLLSAAEAVKRCKIPDLPAFYRSRGLIVHESALPDRQAASPEQLTALVNQIIAAATGRGDASAVSKDSSSAEALTSSSANVLVHCGAGFGRTGMVLACVARTVFPELDAEAAIKLLNWQLDSDAQKEAVAQFVPPKLTTLSQGE